MKHTFGVDEFLLKRKGRLKDVIYDSEELLNNHVLLSGMSGSGKSYQIMSMLSRAAMYDYEIDIFDVHEELALPESTSAKYSSYTKYGYNPLIINTDKHAGGVRNRITSFINMLNTTSSKLGSKQISTLRSLLEDLYAKHGMSDNDIESWFLPPDKQPTIEDLLEFINKKLISMRFGNDAIANRLMELSKSASKLKKLKMENRALNDASAAPRPPALTYDEDGNEILMDDDTYEVEESAELKNFRLLQDQVVEDFHDFVFSISDGNELNNFFRYDNKDVLISIRERIVNLNASGIFNHNPPDFNGNNVRCHEIKSLSDDEQCLFVYTKLESIFNKLKAMGPTDTIRHIIVLDEAHKFFDDASDNIINIIAKEARKFGACLWCASQSPSSFSEDFLSNTATIILLGIHSSYWDIAARKLRIKAENLKYTKPKQVASIKFQKKGASDANFQNVILSSYLDEFFQKNPRYKTNNSTAEA